MSRNTQAHISLFIVNLIYGINFLVAKGLMPNLIGPSGFIVLRVSGAALLFGITWLFFSRQLITDKKDLKRIFFCAVFGVVINQLLFFNGLCVTSPVNASIIMVSTPVLVLMISAILIKEKITGRKLIGVLLGTMGAVVLILSRTKGDATSSLSGDLMVFFNAASYAISLILVRPLMSKYKPLVVITHMFFFALPMVLPFGWNQFTQIQWGQFTQANYLAAGFVVVFVTYLSYLLNTFALKFVSASVTSVYVYMQPFVATVVMYLAATFWGGAPVDLTITKFLCGISIFTGVYLVSRNTKPSPLPVAE